MMLPSSSEKSKGIKRECKSLSGSLENFELQAQFQHYRSESYANTLCAQGRGGSQSSVCGEEMASPYLFAKVQPKKSRFVPISAPTSPSRRNITSVKSSTLPPSYGLDSSYRTQESAPSRKSRIASFFKRLSPKLKRSSSKEKPWIVVEFSQSELDGESADASSIGSDQSFELALRTREEQQKISPSCTNGESMANILPLPSKLMNRGSLETLESEPVVPKTRKFIKAKDVQGRKPYNKQITLSKELQELLDFKLGRLKYTEDSLNGVEIGDERTDESFEEEKLDSLPHPIVTLSHPQDSFSSSDHGAGNVQLLHSSDQQLKSEVSGQPHFHRIHQPPRTLDILNKIVVHSPKMEKSFSKLTSVESIGSCSLDVEATVSETSGIADGRVSSVSQHTLHSKGSVDLSNGVSTVQHSHKADSFVGEFQHIGPTITSGNHQGSNGVIDHKLKISRENESLSHQPSYVNISCSVSGYSSFSCYSSKVREGLHYHSPGVTTLGSLEADLVETTGKQTVSQQSKSEKTMYLSVGQAAYRDQLSSSSAANLRTQFCSDDQIRRNSGDGNINARLQVNGVRREPFSKSDYSLELNERVDKTCGSQMSSSKSLVQQRIECLYGPNALTQGLQVNRARPRDTVCRKFDSDILKSAPSVNGELKAGGVGTVPKKTFDRTGSIDGISSQQILTEDDVTKSGVPHVQVDYPYLNGHHHHELKSISSQQLTTTSADNKNISTIEGSDTVDISQQMIDVEKDGHYFMKIMDSERQKIKKLVNEGEIRLMDGHLTEEFAGRYRAAIGKANLLLSQKFPQFQGLCDKNINQLPDDPLQTLSCDLEGFWDTILLQVNDIYELFQEIGLLQDNQGTSVASATETDSEMKGELKAAKSSNGVKPKRLPLKLPSAGGTRRSEKAEAAARAREDARKKLAEMKRKARCNVQQADDQEVEIFIPGSRGQK